LIAQPCGKKKPRTQRMQGLKVSGGYREVFLPVRRTALAWAALGGVQSSQ
jgi:hypothetical protein